MIALPRVTSLPKPLLATLATLFAAATIFYSVLWIRFQFSRPPVQLGFDDSYLQPEHCDLITSVYKDSPAEKAGLRAGDCILKAGGEGLESSYSIQDIWARHKPGDAIDLMVKRPHVPGPLAIRGVFRAWRSPTGEAGLTEHMGRDVASTLPVGFLVVGLAVLFPRCQRHLPTPLLLETVLSTVQKFSDAKQADDITLVIARCKP